MTRHSIQLSSSVQDCLLAHCTPLDEIARELMDETFQALPADAKMQVAPEQAGLLTLLTRLLEVRQAVEVGTFTGMSSLAIARGMPADGRLICFHASAEFTAVAQRYWRRAGVADRIELRLGPAADRLPESPPEPVLDLVFIDADKENYPTYWRELVPRVRPGGLIAVDNVLWGGRVAEPAVQDETTLAIRRFNDEIVKDDRVELMLPIADGLTLAHRR